MADYHRFVAYIYEYINGRKSRNTGFAKVESRNGICRIQIHVPDILPMEGKIEVFGFVRENGMLPAVPLAEGQVQSGNLDRRITTPEETFGGSRYGFSQISGIWIRSASGRNWITIFDDEPVEIEKLGKIPEKHETEKGTEEEQKEEKEEKQRMEEFIKEEDNDAGEIKKAEEIERDDSEERKAVKESPQEETAEGILEEKNNEAVKEALEENEIKMEKETPKKEQKEVVKQISERTQIKSANKITQRDQSEKREDKENTSNGSVHTDDLEPRDCIGCTPGTDKRWNCVTARYSHFQPVSDGSIVDAIRIQPSDLRTLWQKGWKQGNNSFLMHGFYQYHHLMLGKCREGGYVLGIPGQYNEQEKNMAGMFGFPDFRPADGKAAWKDAPGGQPGRIFGYWCRAMND